MPFQVGHPKYGGVKKGTSNKFSLKFAQVLEKNKFIVAQKAIDMWNEIPEGPLWYDVKLKILEFLAKYSFPRPTIDVNLDVNNNSKPLDGFTTRELIEAIPTIESKNENQTYGTRSD